MIKRFRPRFSIRTLAIVVTLVGAYFGVWEATKQWGTRLGETTRYINYKGNLYSYRDVVIDANSPLPFVVRRDVYSIPEPPLSVRVNPTRRYYVWLFGISVKQLPHPKNSEDYS